MWKDAVNTDVQREVLCWRELQSDLVHHNRLTNFNKENTKKILL